MFGLIPIVGSTLIAMGSLMYGYLKGSKETTQQIIGGNVFTTTSPSRPVIKNSADDVSAFSLIRIGLWILAGYLALKAVREVAGLVKG
jgi:hypothetical protein